MMSRVTDRLLSRSLSYLFGENGMRRFGIANVMRLAKSYNRVRYRERWNKHMAAYLTELPQLLQENGGPSFSPAKPRLKMKDGWALDTSRSLPHLDRLLTESSEVIEERGGRNYPGAQQPFLRGLLFPGDLEKYPSFLDFILSSELLATVIDYLGTIPVLSKTRPPGVRFMESNAKLDPDAGGAFRESQLYHLDLHDSPLVYVLVLLRDVTFECGPWTFLPISSSDRTRKQLNYQRCGRSYRVTDEEMYRHIAKEEAIEFAYPRGTVLFIDSSRCFHFGSRNAISPRFMMMYGLTTPCRADFSMTFMPSHTYPTRPDDSRLRRMILE